MDAAPRRPPAAPCAAVSSRRAGRLRVRLRPRARRPFAPRLGTGCCCCCPAGMLVLGMHACSALLAGATGCISPPQAPQYLAPRLTADRQLTARRTTPLPCIRPCFEPPSCRSLPCSGPGQGRGHLPRQGPQRHRQRGDRAADGQEPGAQDPCPGARVCVCASRCWCGCRCCLADSCCSAVCSPSRWPAARVEPARPACLASTPASL